MSSVYITQQGAHVVRAGQRLRVFAGRDMLKEFKALQLQQLVIVGNVELTSPAIALLLELGIDTVFLTMSGRFKGRLDSASRGKNVLLRHKQFECAGDQAFRLAFAKAIVDGKIHNMRVVLMRNRRARQLDELNVSISNVRRLGERVASATDVDTLRGLEGAATAAYFGGLRHLFTQDLGFSARVRRPPTDPINAMLSFGYTLLGQAVEMAVLTSGLDPHVGFVHSLHYGRPSLMLDLIEEFRPIVVDSLVLRVLNNRWLTKDDFIWTDDTERPVSLSQEALRRFIGYFEKTMETAVSHPEVEGKVTYRRCLHLQARQAARYIKGEVSAYRPVVYR